MPTKKAKTSKALMVKTTKLEPKKQLMVKTTKMSGDSNKMSKPTMIGDKMRPGNNRGRVSSKEQSSYARKSMSEYGAKGKTTDKLDKIKLREEANIYLNQARKKKK